MTFFIDTGGRDHVGWKVDVVGVIADSGADAAGPNATAEEVCIAQAKLIIAKLWSGKKPETVRRHFVQLWPLIAPMADIAPDSFDQIITEFAERATEFR